MRGDMAAFATAVGIADPLLSSVKLAVSEAVTNVVMHAYAGAEAPGEVRLCATADDHRVYVTISDDGCGMVPRLDSPGLGVGLPFIAHSSDTLDIGRNDTGGTDLRMSFRLPADNAR